MARRSKGGVGFEERNLAHQVRDDPTIDRDLEPKVKGKPRHVMVYRRPGETMDQLYARIDADGIETVKAEHLERMAANG